MHVCPVPLPEYQLAIMARFANSERAYLLEMADQTRTMAGDDLSLAMVIDGRIPEGFMGSTPILNQLLDSLELTGDFSIF